jgi:hypothetical protein
MRFIVALLSLMFFFLPNASQGPAFADVRNSGNMFLAKCESDTAATLDDISTQDFCNGYAVGLADSVQIRTMYAPPAPTCPPTGVMPAQMRRIAVKYMKDHPEKTHEQTALLMFEAWAEAFPCPAKK